MSRTIPFNILPPVHDEYEHAFATLLPASRREGAVTQAELADPEQNPLAGSGGTFLMKFTHKHTYYLPNLLIRRTADYHPLDKCYGVVDAARMDLVNATLVLMLFRATTEQVTPAEVAQLSELAQQRQTFANYSAEERARFNALAAALCGYCVCTRKRVTPGAQHRGRIILPAEFVELQELCAPHYGHRMIESVHAITDPLGLPIVLSALYHVVPFYRAHDYRASQSCPTYPFEVSDIEDALENLLNKTPPGERINTTRKSYRRFICALVGLPPDTPKAEIGLVPLLRCAPAHLRTRAMAAATEAAAADDEVQLVGTWTD